MTEEQVTKSILYWLKNHGWEIISFEFPQSGTGRLLHPDDAPSEKNKGGITPDIVAARDGIAVFFEDKNRFCRSDFQKANDLRTCNNYTRSIADLLKGKDVTQLYYGIGMPSSKYSKNAADSANKVDFVLGVQEDGSICILALNIAPIF